MTNIDTKGKRFIQSLLYRITRYTLILKGAVDVISFSH